MRQHGWLVLALGVGAAAGAMFLGFATARATVGTRRSEHAVNPCHDLSGQFLTACEKALAACNQQTGSVKTHCLSSLTSSFDPLRKLGKTTTTTTTTSTGGGGAGGGGGGGGPSSANAPPPPVSGSSADVTPVKGTVLVNGKPLTTGERIPVGATVDTTNGTVKLESVSPTGTLQTALFDGAIFKLEQAKHGITDLILIGGDFGVCSTKGRFIAAAGPKTTVVRSLWGNGHGQFSTKGRYAAATVRGTWWNTEDRCDGTLIRVKRGVVSVLDLVTHKTVSVSAGHNYLATP